MSTPIRYIGNTFSDDDSEGSSDETEGLSNATDSDSEESAPSEGPDPLRREYPDYPAQDEGQDDGGGGGGSSDGGGSGGGSAPAAAAAAPDPAADDKKKRHHEWRKKKREEERAKRAAERATQNQSANAPPVTSPVDKSIVRHERKAPKPSAPPPIVVLPSVQSRQASVAQTSVTQRIAKTPLYGVTSVAKAPSPAVSRTTSKSRKFGHDHVPVEDDDAGFADDPNGPTEYEGIAWELGDKWETTPKEAEAVFGGILTSDDMVAIQKYIADTPATTPDAVKVKDSFTKWYDSLYWYERSLQSSFDKARNYRNQFNLANASSPEEKAAIQDVIKSGLSSEQAQGNIDRRTSTGMYAILPASLLPWEVAGVVLAALTLLVGVNAAVKHHS